MDNATTAVLEAALKAVKAQRDKLAMLHMRIVVMKYHMPIDTGAKVATALARNCALRQTAVEKEAMEWMSAELDRLAGLPT